MFPSLAVQLLTVFSLSSLVEAVEERKCSGLKSKFANFLKIPRQTCMPNFKSDVKLRSDAQTVRLANLGWNRFRIAKRDEVTKDNEDWSEAFNMFDWWKNLRHNRKHSAKKDPVSNSVKRVCFDEILNAQLSNKSYLSLIHFKPRLSEPFGYFETPNSPWSTAKLTELQMDNSVKSVVNVTDDVKDVVTTTSDCSTENYVSPIPSRQVLKALLTSETTRGHDLRKAKKEEKKDPKVEKDKSDKKEKNTNRLILTLNENKKETGESKTSKPFGNFSVEYVENAGKAPSCDQTTIKISYKTGEKPPSKKGGKKKGYRTDSLPEQMQHDRLKLGDTDVQATKDDTPKEKKTRKVRSLYPNPTDSRQFHLMHGLYSGNGPQMEDALRQAELQALNVASALQRVTKLRQDSPIDAYGPRLRLQQEQIVPEYPQDMGMDEEPTVDKNRHSKRKISSLQNDPYSMFDSQLEERMKFLNDLNSAITKKKEELDILERTFKSEQSVVGSLDNNLEDTNMLNPNFMNSPQLGQQLKRNLQYTNNNHNGMEKFPPNMDPLRMIGPAGLVPRDMTNSSLANNPYLESILRAYASNYLSPILNQQNATTPELHGRAKREISDLELERPPTIKKKRFNPYNPSNMDKENLLNSLKELEQLEKILVREYEKDYGTINDKKTDKRWLLSGKDTKTMCPYAAPADEACCLALQKSEGPEPIHQEFSTSRKKLNKTTATDYCKKFCVLENDLIDLKNAISNINSEQSKMDKSDNDTNNIFVQVNVSVALFNGSSTPAVCECVCKRNSDALRCPLVGASVAVNKINVTDAPGQNKKTQVGLSQAKMKTHKHARVAV